MRPTSIRAQICDYVDSLPLFDSHSHMAGFDDGTTLDRRRGVSLASVLVNDYLAYLAPSCGDLPPGSVQACSGEDAPLVEYERIKPLLAACRGLNTYAAYREALRELHPFDGDDLCGENWEQVDASVKACYARGGELAWQREVIARADVYRQVQICQFPYVADHWAHLPAPEREAQAALLLPSLVIDGFCFTGLAGNVAMRGRTMQLLECRPATYAEHLAFCRLALDRFVEGGGRSVKLLAAYVRALRFEDVPVETGERLYSQGVDDLADGELAVLQDHLVWRVLEMAHQRNLPLLVHTGYSVPTAWGEPDGLLPFLTAPRLAGLKVGLCHAGWPNAGQAMLLARTYRQCYMDLSWIPLLSPEVARRILAEAIDIIPANKIMVGTDCGTAECFYGAVAMIRRVLADVLAGKMESGQFGMDTAQAVARSILYGTACEFFGEPLPGVG